ncbi:uncharacterized protein BDZ99DRAFT_529299 [Mytilinidion resinicola]|uniref:Uncharacterized protein n=1 Tax=Mytilinidion resinicola TaxID=574789 RepID=A0A6A6Z8L6_9PEZI|nr:uncharacterized protein BDZ99DRAFT_529299 [Mytilinidion resinicola]KAF2817073.1 hypothetical protein BDZ99DRAFT_529299 [Mytilinidion resinicola]
MGISARADEDAAARTPQKLIAYANSNDRYRLFNDVSVPFPDLEDNIHPVFRRSNFRNVGFSLYQKIRPSLRLASLFLESEAMLGWFIRPAFGTPIPASQSRKVFLTEPKRSRQRTAEMIREIRSLLIGLSYSVEFHFVEELKCFALTCKDTSKETSYLAKFWSPVFTSAHPTTIKLRDTNREFIEYDYSSSSLCDRLRFDFMFATTILHELTHAFGIMIRGNLREPYYDLTDPQAEFGWSWERFALTGIINPFDRTSARVSFLMWKVWLDDDEAYANGGKEWTAVPVQWVSQWFQKSTWDAIAEYGPEAVAPPSCDLKLHCTRDGLYTVLSDNEEVLRDVLELKSEALAAHRSTLPGTKPSSLMSVRTIKTNNKTHPTFAQETIARRLVSVSSRASRALDQAGLTLGAMPPLLHGTALKRRREGSAGDADSDDGVNSPHSRWKRPRV